MNQENLLRRLEASEDCLVERKPEGVNADELRRTICAFANSVGTDETAILFIGVADNGTPIGVSNPDDKQKQLRRICEQICYPPVRYQAYVINHAGCHVVAVVIPESKAKPHFSGPAFVRRGSESVAASAEQYENLILSRSDKAGALQRIGRSPITVHSMRHRLGSTKPIADQSYRESAECIIESCDAHVVKLSVLASGRRVSEPLENITISYDEERQRPLLIVSMNRS